ncbi:Serine/threonine-protein kinase CTR1 [Porphyridium purpureum]|uniref:Serine/threonine-protein kinase CTR1 n=1 Tax=Porphyridium purpureum TaxID=35688 RepID=A0A5J4Z5B8_PORPP|nr:Serine/threonine-protein kinase CTR1 [Porphyridium purpureum]|eukprot:POR0205..scf295_1
MEQPGTMAIQVPEYGTQAACTSRHASEPESSRGASADPRDLEEFMSWASRSPSVRQWLAQLSELCGARVQNEGERKLLQIEFDRLGISVPDSNENAHGEVKEHECPSIISSTSADEDWPDNDDEDEVSLDLDADGSIELSTSRDGSVAAGDYFLLQKRSSSLESVHSQIDRSFAISYNDLVVKEVIGTGAHATVHAGEWLHMPVAIKMFNTDVRSSARRAGRIHEMLLAECQVMSSLRHPNVLLYMGVVCNDVEHPLCIVSELFTGGSLSNWLEQNAFDPVTSLQIALKCARGMLYLHSRSVPLLHRDLKSDNILVDARADRVVISDFGLSVPEDEVALDNRIIGTVQTMAPEVMVGAAATPAADVFAFGVVLWELFTHRKAWEHVPAATIMYRVLEGNRLPLTCPDTDGADAVPEVARIPPAIRELIACMWHADPAQRPSFLTCTSTLSALCASHSALI